MQIDALQHKLRAYLTKATRHGIYASTATRRGLALDSVRPGFVLALETVEQIIGEVSTYDAAPLIEQLYIRRAENLPKDPVAIFKLRSMLLLGLGSAKFLKPDERRLALVRTYRVNPLLAEDPARGAMQFRNRTGDLFRAERDQLLDEASECLAASVERFTISESAAESSNEWLPANGDAYRIVEYDDQHVYPATVDQRRWVMRTRTIKALRDGVTQFRQQYTVITSWGVTPVLRFVGVGQFSVERMRPHEVNGERGYIYELSVVFPPMAKDTTRVLQWIVEFDQDAAWYGGRGIQNADVRPSVGIDHATISVRFEQPLVPARCWRFDNVPIGDARLEEAMAEELVPEAGVYRGEWTNVRAGRASGIAWRWSSEDAGTVH